MSNSQLVRPHKRIGVGVIRHSKVNKILVSRRLRKGDMGGLWEFPGGKMETNETVGECIRREIKEELGIEVLVKEHLVTIDHQYPNFGVTLFVHHCQHVGGVPRALESEEISWVTLDELTQLQFPEANYKIIALLEQLG